jgi:hypothetical protein
VVWQPTNRSGASVRDRARWRAWNVRFTTAYSSVTEAKREAEHRYPGLSTRWKRTGVSKAQAKAWAKRMWKAFACSFCGLPPYEIQFMFERNKVRLCDRCVDAAVAELQRLRAAKAVSDKKREEQLRQQIAKLQQRRASGTTV